MSFQQGLSGLNAASFSLNVIGNNIANAQTVGAKASTAEFAGLYASSLNGAASSGAGIGVSTGTGIQSFSQGSITTTGNPTDLAISGNGFFQIKDPSSGNTNYTRNGQFTISNSGNLVNNQGALLMGFGAVNGVITAGVAAPLQLPTNGQAATESTTTTLAANLSSTATSIASAANTYASTYFGTTVPVATAAAPVTTANLMTSAATGTMNPSDPNSFTSATSTTVYDSKGNPITMSYYFQNVGTDSTNGQSVWNVYATANGQPISGDTNETATSLDPLATIVFPSNGGNPAASTTNTALGVFQYTYSGTTQTASTTAATGATMNLLLPSVTSSSGLTTNAIPDPSLPTSTSNPATGLAVNLLGMTANSSAFSVSTNTSNGNAPGQLTGVNIASDGILTATYSNGGTQAVGQVQLANFEDPNGLQPLGGNAWAETNASGQPVTNVPGSGNMGSLQAGAVEDSNIDLTTQLVNMMTAQRVYQANAQTITTQNQVLQTLLQMR